MTTDAPAKINYTEILRRILATVALVSLLSILVGILYAANTSFSQVIGFVVLSAIVVAIIVLPVYYAKIAYNALQTPDAKRHPIVKAAEVLAKISTGVSEIFVGIATVILGLLFIVGLVWGIVAIGPVTILAVIGGLFVLAAILDRAGA